ncbi:MAG: hypothetical protein IKY94_08815 [Lachnospiraceae bacterium]|nr:hypothetical protein [Lachnospiraceae bacterium]
MKRLFKGIFVCIFVVLVIYLIWDKSFPTVFQSTLGISKLQSSEIEEQLQKQLSFECNNLEKYLSVKILPD